MQDCIEWQGGKSKSGYGAVRYKGKIERAHRVAYVESKGLTMQDIAGLVVRHRCDNPACVNPDHLETGTQADNMEDMHARGRSSVKPGVRLWSKLRPEDIPEIRRRLESGERLTSIARSFNVNHGTIRAIKIGRTWTSIR